MLIKIKTCRLAAVFGRHRTIARLRSCFPLLFFVPGVLLGQSFAHIAAAAGPGIVLSLPLGLLFWKYRRFGFWRQNHFSLAFALGCLSILPLLLQSALPLTDGEYNFLALVDDQTRHRQAGLVELSLLSVDSSTSDSSKKSGSLPPGRRVLCRAVDLPWKNISKAEQGMILMVSADLKKLSLPFNPFSYQATLLRHSYTALCKIKYASVILADRSSLLQKFRSNLLETLRSILGRGEQSELFLSMLIGTRDQLSSRTESAFKRCGLAHLLVVSGYQVTLIYYFIFCLCQALLRWLCSAGEKSSVEALSHAAALGASVFFVALVGADGPSLRAAIAVLLVFLCKILERETGMLHAISAALLLLTILWPGCFFEPGIQLTFAALSGICLGISYPRDIPLKRYLRVCFCASLFTSPVVLAWFDQFSLAGFVLNPLMAPLSAFLSCKAGALAIVLFGSGIDSNGICLRKIAEILAGIKDLILAVSDLPLSCFYLNGWYKAAVLLLICAVIIALLVRRYRLFLLEHSLP